MYCKLCKSYEESYLLHWWRRLFAIRVWKIRGPLNGDPWHTGYTLKGQSRLHSSKLEWDRHLSGRIALSMTLSIVTSWLSVMWSSRISVSNLPPAFLTISLMACTRYDTIKLRGWHFVRGYFEARDQCKANFLQAAVSATCLPLQPCKGELLYPIAVTREGRRKRIWWYKFNGPIWLIQD